LYLQAKFGDQKFLLVLKEDSVEAYKDHDYPQSNEPLYKESNLLCLIKKIVPMTKK
jgi:hypothetical protein